MNFPSRQQLLFLITLFLCSLGLLIYAVGLGSGLRDYQQNVRLEMEQVARGLSANQLLIGDPALVTRELAPELTIGVFGFPNGDLRIATNPNIFPTRIPEELLSELHPESAESVTTTEVHWWANELGTQLFIADQSAPSRYWIGVARLEKISDLPFFRSAGQAGWIALAIVGAGLAAVIILDFYQQQQLQKLVLITRNLIRSGPHAIGEYSPPDAGSMLLDAIHKLYIELQGRGEMLERERTTLDAVLAQIQDGILVVDEKGQVILINPMAARIFDTTSIAARGRSLAQVLYDHRLLGLWEAYLETKQEQSLALDLPLQKLYIQAIVTGFGSRLPGHALLLIQDLTRVRRLETVRRDFVSNISHELRTPLASLKALAETLKDGALQDPAAAVKFLDLMDGEVEALTQLTAELLELARMESGQSLSVFRPCDPCTLIKQAVTRLQVQAQRANVGLSYACEPGLAPISADADRLVQVFVNLIHNAIKFTPAGGTITVGVRQRDTTVEFTVADEGIGIGTEHLPRIFERFYKADPARSSGGTGLGLAIAKHIVELHHGTIQVSSREGEGTIFTIGLSVID